MLPNLASLHHTPPTCGVESTGARATTMLSTLGSLRPRPQGVGVNALPHDVVKKIVDYESRMQTVSLEISSVTRPRQNNQWCMVDVSFGDLLKARTRLGARPGIVAARASNQAMLVLKQSWNDVEIEFRDAGPTNSVVVQVQNPIVRDVSELRTESGQVETTRSVFNAIEPMLTRLLSNAGLFRASTDALRLAINSIPPTGSNDSNPSAVPAYRIVEGKIDVVRPPSTQRLAVLLRALGSAPP